MPNPAYFGRRTYCASAVSYIHRVSLVVLLIVKGRLRLCTEKNVSRVIQIERSTETHIVTLGGEKHRASLMGKMHGRSELAVYCKKFARVV